MTFLEIFILGLLVVMVMMTILWIVSVFIKNASIVDPFWGMGFVVLAFYYYFQTSGWGTRKIILVVLVCLWGLRLSIYLARRNWGKGEDFRYRQFRQKYGPHRYWWFSFFQVFLLQGILMWLISAPLLGAQYYTGHAKLNMLDILGVLVWLIGIIFEAGGDFQLARFKANPQNKGKVLDTGLWKYTRHPNYFGDSCVWWGYGLICLAGGSYIPVYGSILMTALIIRVSGVFLLERSLSQTKPEYRDYIKKTNAFFPWFPKNLTL
jgi:steroid 5-alpha reductase family enzyme